MTIEQLFGELIRQNIARDNTAKLSVWEDEVGDWVPVYRITFGDNGNELQLWSEWAWNNHGSEAAQ